MMALARLDSTKAARSGRCSRLPQQFRSAEPGRCMRLHSRAPGPAMFTTRSHLAIEAERPAKIVPARIDGYIGMRREADALKIALPC